MPVDFKTKAVRDFINAQVGAPVVEALDKELSAIQTAINISLISYWEAFPWKYEATYDLSGVGSLIVDVSNLMTQISTDTKVQSKAYFQGITKMDLNQGGVAGGSNINSYLLGVPFYSTSYGGGVSDVGSMVDIMQMTRYQTEVAFISGNPDLKYDPTTNQVTVLTPYTFGQLSVDWAFGFFEDIGMAYVRNNQLGLFRKMAAIEFLNIIEAARGQVKLNSDFQLDLSVIQSKRDKLKSEVDDDMSNQFVTPMTWG